MSTETDKKLLPSSSVDEIIKLLDLFPVSSVRATWSEKAGHKDELLKSVAKKAAHQEIIAFIKENIGFCKQHIYVYSHDDVFGAQMFLDLTDCIKAAEWREDGWQKALFTVRYSYKVALRNPFEEVQVPFIWPFLVERNKSNFIARLVIMEKSITSYLDGKEYYKAERDLDDEGIVRAIVKSPQQEAGQESPKVVDITKGIKHLWENDVIDARIVNFKKAKSASREVMDKNFLLKRDNPAEYQKAIKAPLFRTLFQAFKSDKILEFDFTAEPEKGFIGLSKFVEQKGDVDYVVREVLRHNK